jgi:hypothetical protein
MRLVVITIILFLLTTGLLFAQQNEAFIDQIGEFNDATVTQTGLEQYALVSQEGSHEVFINQSGQLNSATVNQLGTGSGSYDSPMLGQNGIPIQFSEGVQSSNSVAQIDQAGVRNSAQVNQFGSHRTDITQQGSFNSVTVEQAGISGSKFNPPGNGNPNPPPFSTEMGYGDGAFALINQFGDDNLIQLTQYGENYAEIFQNGVGNEANVNQIGFDNQAIINQHGNGQSAFIEQIGSGNRVFINQN